MNDNFYFTYFPLLDNLAENINSQVLFDKQVGYSFKLEYIKPQSISAFHQDSTYNFFKDYIKASPLTIKIYKALFK